MSHSTRSFIPVLGALALLLSGSSHGQIRRGGIQRPKLDPKPSISIVQSRSVSLRAATAVVGGKPEVRLRWTILEDWFPAGGFRVYAVTGANRRLVKSAAPPQDSAVDGLLSAPFKGRNLFRSASQPVAGLPKLDLGSKRPAPSLDSFRKLKAVQDDLRSLRGPVLGSGKKAAMDAKSKELVALKTPSASPQKLSNLPPNALATFRARQELSLAALVSPAAAETIGLGATDKAVSNGTKVTYALHSVDASGKESANPVAIEADFEVGSDPAVPAPTGLEFAQEEGKILLRWARTPEDFETAVGAVSYRIARRGPGESSAKILTAKPLLILDQNGVEPPAFFTDTLSRPGDYFYTVVCIDGFGREAASVPFLVQPKDWRRPNAPRVAAAALTARMSKTSKSRPGGRSIPSIQGLPSVRVSWQGVSPAEGLTTRYHVYRADLDAPSQPPVKLTPTPAEGTPIPIATDAQFFAAVDAVLGEDYFDKIDAAIEEAEATVQNSANAALKAKAQKALARQKAIRQIRIQALKNSWSRVPPRQYLDTSVGLDRKVAYYVTAIHAENGLESEETSAGEVSVPDPRQPAAPTGASSAFQPSPPSLRRFSQVKSAPRVLSQPVKRIAFDPTPTAAKSIVLPKARSLPKLSLPPADSAGTVTLRWTPPPGLKEASFQIRRKSSGGGGFVEVGLAKEGGNFVDTVARGRKRTLIYQIATMSRWGIVGPPVETTIELPATVAPEIPNLLSAGPGNDGQILVRVARPSEEEGVTSITVFRDGAQAGSVAVANAPPGDLIFTDSGRTPNQVHAYTAMAVVAGGGQSAKSAEVRAAAIRTVAAPATGLQAVRTPKGVQLNWTIPADTVSTTVRRADAAAGPFQVIAGKLSGAAYLDPTALPGARYFYQVTLIDRFGNVSVPVLIQVQP